MRRLDHYWYSQNPVAWSMLPFSWLFCIVALMRRLSYVKGWLRARRVELPVVIVGNISVGGTGKTPLIIGLCNYLVQQGFSPGVVSRGYGASFSGEHSVAANDDAAVCGDEPLLVKHRTGCPVVVGKDRVAAARKLIAENDCDVVLSDDGMQHYRLHRDVELAVVDADRKFGNGFCLPAGPLRETESRLGAVDMVVLHGAAEGQYRFSLEFKDAVNLVTAERKPLDSFYEVTVHAVAGIGYPKRFFNQLRSCGLNVIDHPFPDHHAFSIEDITFEDDLPILMTEKDAVKCARLQPPQGDDRVLGHCWSVPVSAQLSSCLGPDLIELIRRSQ